MCIRDRCMKDGAKIIKSANTLKIMFRITRRIIILVSQYITNGKSQILSLCGFFVNMGTTVVNCTERQ